MEKELPPGKSSLLELKKLRVEMQAILNAVEEGIEVADHEGFIRYVNPAFTRVTGIPQEMRLGKNIFDLSPNGALAQTLLTQQPLLNHRTKVSGTEHDAIVNAMPVVVDGAIEGAVVVFQPITDVLRYMDEVQQKQTLIENLQARLAELTGGKVGFEDLAGASKLFHATVEMAKKAARSNAPVLIMGEAGTGKRSYAHAIYNQGSRAGHPLLQVNCAELPESLLEGEIFGYEKRAFPGAVKTRLGKLELASGGTIFFHQIGKLNSYLQQRLLPVLQGKEFERMGSSGMHKTDVRVITSSSCDLKELVAQGGFREDLYHLLSGVEINLPPLRERKEDIQPLAEKFLQLFNQRYGKRVLGLEPATVQILAEYRWPGNVRELKVVLERAFLACQEVTIAPSDLGGEFGRSLPANAPLGEVSLDKMELMMLKAALTRYGDTLEGKKRAAQSLNISLATLYNKIKKYKANL